MQTLRNIRHRHFNICFCKSTISYQISFFHPPSTTTTNSPPPNPSSLTPYTNNNPNDIVSSFKDWFSSRKNPFLEQIFHILRTQEGPSLESSFRNLNISPSENLVLQLLNYNPNSPDVLSCLKFFDWAGRQKGFYHTRATYSTIFRILSKSNFISLMLEFLENYLKERHVHKHRFYTTLVIGYSVVGKPETALQMFGRMRFHGLDLDSFGYNVLLNGLVEVGDDDGVEMVVRQIRDRGLENKVTRGIVMKSFCKKGEFGKAEEYLRGLGEGELSGVELAELVDALCKDKQFRRAAALVEDIKKRCYDISMEPVYGVWIRYLVKAGKLGGALEFLKDKRIIEGYIPDVFRYNSLVNKLLQENRLEEVFDLLTEMKEQNIVPDEFTLNSTLCFFCKAGMVDIAVELYDSRGEIGMSVSSMTYNYLINSLVGDVSVDEAYRVLETAINQGYSPGEKTISIIADALCREGKHEKMKNLVLIALENNFKIKDSTYSKFISAFCLARKVHDGYLIHGCLNRLNKETNRISYFNLIKGFNQATRGDIAARLLIEMQEKGYSANQSLFRAVISCLCLMENSEAMVIRLLQMQLTRQKPNTTILNHFIDGAGHARKPEISRKVYEIMKRTGIQPNFRSHILMLNSFLKSGKISDALIFFRGLPEERRTSQKMWNDMIIGLCTVERLDYALNLFWQMRGDEMRPSLLCYEALVKLVCKEKKYNLVFKILDDMARSGRKISTFIGNVLLLDCLNSRKLFDTFVRTRNKDNQTPSDLILGKLIGAFSGCIDVGKDVGDMEELIKQCFVPDMYTYNMLLRRLMDTQIDDACGYLERIREKGYEPNEWTYDSLVHGYYKHGRYSEAKKWRDVMLEKGFGLSDYTKLLA